MLSTLVSGQPLHRQALPTFREAYSLVITHVCYRHERDADVAPQYLIRDRDRAYGDAFTRRIRAMGIRDRPTAPRSPWQNGYAEGLIGSIRRECLDHVIVFGERHLRHVLRSYAEYYNGVRTHLSLTKDFPFTRPVQRVEAFYRSRSLATPPSLCPDLISDNHNRRRR